MTEEQERCIYALHIDVEMYIKRNTQISKPFFFFFLFNDKDKKTLNEKSRISKKQ